MPEPPAGGNGAGDYWGFIEAEVHGTDTRKEGTIKATGPREEAVPVGRLRVGTGGVQKGGYVSNGKGTRLLRLLGVVKKNGPG